MYDVDYHSEAGRRISVYLPMVNAGRPEELCNWPDSEQKKANVAFEYAQQLLSMSHAMVEGKSTKENVDQEKLIMLFKSR